MFSVGSNASHGLRRTNADKRKAVLKLLEDEEWGKWSDRSIGEKCAVSNRFVTNLRNELSVNGSQIPPERKVIRNGTPYIINTDNIGKSKLPPEETIIDITPVGGGEDGNEDEWGKEILIKRKGQD